MLFDQLLLQKRKIDYSLYFGSTEIFHKVVISKETQKFTCQENTLAKWSKKKTN